MTAEKWFLGFLKKYKWLMVLGLVMTTVISVLAIVNPHISGLIVDDVISTGESLNALMQLVEKAGGNIVGMAAVLAEGDAQERDDIVYLDALPLFVKK